MSRGKLIFLLVAASALVLQFALNYDGKPGSHPAPEEVIRLFNESTNHIATIEVLDVIEVSPGHLFVPFINDYGEYGKGYLIWERFKWKVARLSTRNQPELWQIKPRDPSSQVIVWNMDPAAGFQDHSYYYIVERNAGRSYDKDYYSPRIQLELSAGQEIATYGTLAFPDEWKQLSLADLGARSYVGWYYRQRDESIPFNEVFNNGYSTGVLPIRTDFVHLLNENDLNK